MYISTHNVINTNDVHFSVDRLCQLFALFDFTKILLRNDADNVKRKSATQTQHSNHLFNAKFVSCAFFKCASGDGYVNEALVFAKY